MAVKTLKKKIPTESSKESGLAPIALSNGDIEEVRTRYLEGHINELDHHVFESISEICLDLGIDREHLATLRSIADRDGWNDLRRFNKDKIEQARRIEMLNRRSKDSEEFDNEVMKIAKAGLQQIKAHFAISAKNSTPLTVKEIHTLGSALQKYQVAGRLALGDTSDVINEKLDSGMDLSALTKDELQNLNAILKRAENNNNG